MEPRFDADNNSEHFQSIIQRMANAKWITGTNVATRTDLWLTLTELGRQRMKSASDALINAMPEWFKSKNPSNIEPGTIKVARQDMILRVLAVSSIVLELQPPAFSPGEEDTLLGIILDNTRQNAARDDSPPRR
jgi:hypothetical protein